MSRHERLLHRLRAADAELASVGPSPRLEARIRAKLREQGRAPRREPRRAVALAFAVSAAAFAGVLGRAIWLSDHEVAANEEEPELVRERRASEASEERLRPGDADAGPTGRVSPRRHGRLIAPWLTPPPKRSAPPAPSPHSLLTPKVQRDVAPLPSGFAALPPPYDDVTSSGPREPAPSSTTRSLRLWDGKSTSPSDAPPHPTSAAPSPRAAAEPSGGDAQRPPPTAPNAPPPNAPPPPPPPHETKECHTSEEMKSAAEEACEAKGQEVSSIEPSEPCDADSFLRFTYTCADAKQPPEPVCEGWYVGDSKTCMSPAELTSIAAQECSGVGGVLRDFNTAADCPNGRSTFAKIECCFGADPTDPSGATPAPPPDGCRELTVKSPTGCAAYGVLEKQSYATCGELGLTAASVQPAPQDSCPSGSFSWGTVRCCP